MLNLACRRGELEGLVPHLVENGLSHLQYADDTMIFIRNNQTTAKAMFGWLVLVAGAGFV